MSSGFERRSAARPTRSRDAPGPRQPARRAHRLQRRLRAADRDRRSARASALGRAGAAAFTLHSRELGRAAALHARRGRPTSLRALRVRLPARGRAPRRATSAALDIHVASERADGRRPVVERRARGRDAARAARARSALPLDDVEIAQLAQRAEIEYAGVRCGIMDQMASSLADTEQRAASSTRARWRRGRCRCPQAARCSCSTPGVRARARRRAATTSAARECEEACARARRRRRCATSSGVGAVEALPEPLAAPRAPRRQRERARAARRRRRRRARRSAR